MSGLGVGPDIWRNNLPAISLSTYLFFSTVDRLYWLVIRSFSKAPPVMHLRGKVIRSEIRSHTLSGPAPAILGGAPGARAPIQMANKKAPHPRSWPNTSNTSGRGFRRRSTPLSKSLQPYSRLTHGTADFTEPQ